jgi:hypothetical protein
MSQTMNNMAGRRTAKQRIFDHENIIRLLGKKGGDNPPSQNAIYQELIQSTNWATIRRDLTYLINNGVITTEKGPRRAILHFLSLKGILKHISTSTFDQINAPIPDERTEIKARGKQLEELIDFLEREGKRINFVIFSEIKALIEIFGIPTIITTILTTSKFNIPSFFSEMPVTEIIKKNKREMLEYERISKVKGLQIDHEDLETDITALLAKLDRAYRIFFAKSFFKNLAIAHPLRRSGKSPDGESPVRGRNTALFEFAESIAKTKKKEYEAVKKIADMLA